MPIETREVLAGAYRGGKAATMLTHAVEVDDAGMVVRLFCRRVDIDNLADRYASDPHAVVTCISCQRAVLKGVDRGV